MGKAVPPRTRACCPPWRRPCRVLGARPGEMEQCPRGRVPGPSPAGSPIPPWSSGAMLSVGRKEPLQLEKDAEVKTGPLGVLRCRGGAGAAAALGAPPPHRTWGQSPGPRGPWCPGAQQAQCQLPRGPRHLVWKPVPGWVPQKLPLSGGPACTCWAPTRQLRQGSGPDPGLGGFTCTAPSW